jgi:hypothetical protein
MKLILSVVYIHFITLIQYAYASSDFGMKVIAGDGTAGSSGDGGQGTVAQLGYPTDIWADSVGNAYVLTTNDCRVRKVNDATGVITKVIGTLQCDWDYVGRAGTSTPLYIPWGLSGDAAQTNLYVSDYYHIWKYNFATKQVIRYAGGDQNCILGFCPAGPVTSGDGGPATNAYFGSISGIYSAFDGTLYVTDRRTHNVRKIASANPHIISFVAGYGQGFDGDNGPTTSTIVKFNNPSSVYVETTGAIYIGDDSNLRVRYINPGNGIITTYAGGGSATPVDGLAATDCPTPWNW